MSEWQPIETAPEDTSVLVWANCALELGHYNTMLKAWVASYDHRPLKDVLLWRFHPPLPNGEQTMSAYTVIRKANWQPIASAPRDGTWIMILCAESIQEADMPKPCVFTARWVTAWHEWWESVSETRKELRKEDASRWSCYEYPTHWMPLPEPPK
jgi:hypothetical protein